MVGFYPTLTAFLKFLLVLILFNLSTASFALLMAACISNASVANLFATIGILFSMLFGGFLLNRSRIPGVLAFLPYLSPFNYAFEALIVNELARIVLHDTETIEFDVPGTLILKQFGFDAEAWGKDAWCLAGMLIILLIAAFVGTKMLVTETR